MPTRGLALVVFLFQELCMYTRRLVALLAVVAAPTTLLAYGCVPDESLLDEDAGKDGDGSVTTNDAMVASDTSSSAKDAGTSTDAHADTGLDAGPPPPPVDGGLLVARHFPVTGASPPFAVVAYDNVGNIITGTLLGQPTGLDDASVSPDGGGFDFVITKMTQTGQVIWMTSYGGPGEDDVDSIATDANGDIFISGRFTSATLASLTHRGDSQYDGFVMKLSGVDGSIIDAIDTVAVGGHTNGVKIAVHGTDLAIASSVTGNASVRNAGGTETSIPQYDTVNKTQDVFVALLDGSNFHEKWHLFIGGSAVENMMDVATGPDGDVYVAGEFQSTQLLATGGALALDRKSTGALGDSFVVRLESTNGVPQWATGYGSGDNATNYVYTSAIAVSQSTADVFLLAALQGSVAIGTKTATAATAGQTDALAARLAGKDGATVWARSFGGAGSDRALNGATAPADGVYLTGDYFSAGMTFDGFMLKAPFGAGSALFTARLGADGTALWAAGISSTAASSNTQASGAASFEDSGVAAFAGSFKGFVNFGDDVPQSSGAVGGTPGQLYDLFIVERAR